MISRLELFDAIDTAERIGLIPFVIVVPISPEVLATLELERDAVEHYLQSHLERHVRELVTGQVQL